MNHQRPPARARKPVVLLALALALAALSAQAADDPGLAYVSNQGGDVSVIDLSTLEMRGTIPAHGGEPRGIGITADGAWLVVATRTDGSISVIERGTGRLVRKIEIGANPEFVRVRGRTAFVSYEPSSKGKPSPDAQGDAAAEATPARVAVVDLEQGRIVRTIEGGLETEGIEFSADRKHLLVTNEEDDTVTVRDIATGALVKTIDTKPYGKRPRGIKIAPDGKRYVVTLELGNSFVVIGPDYTVQKKVETAESPYGIAFDRSGERLFVAAAKSRVLQVYDAGSWTHIKDVPTGQRCWHFSFTPDDTKILVACGRSGEVVVIDAQRLEPIKHIADERLPWGVLTYPKSAGSLDSPQ